MFFSIMGFLWEHWILSVVYLFLVSPVVAKFYRKFVPQWGKTLRAVFVCPFIKQSGKLGMMGWPYVVALLLWKVAMIPLLYMAGPLLYFPIYYRAKKEKARRLAEQAELEEGKRKLESENNSRGGRRREWLKENGVTLYYNTIAGVTTVLTKAAYAKNQRESQSAVLDGEWPTTVYLPSPEAFLFATCKAKKVFETTFNVNPPTRYSFLDEVVQWAKLNGIKVELEQDQRIFVPGASTALLTLDSQRTYRGNGWSNCTSRHLIDEQAPAELHHLPTPS